jgi:hypothetical protein
MFVGVLLIQCTDYDNVSLGVFLIQCTDYNNVSVGVSDTMQRLR